MSRFKSDLLQEQILAQYLNSIYRKKGFDFRRSTTKAEQHLGIDLIIEHDGIDFNIDEKAQLHYLNKDLPTFTFELSYLNSKNAISTGWLMDTCKKTHYYFLVTAIFTSQPIDKLCRFEDISSVKIMSVSRLKLLHFLENIGLAANTLEDYDSTFRNHGSFGKNIIEELNPRSEGLIYFTEHLAEHPMNLQLRLDFLIRSRVAKRIQ